MTRIDLTYHIHLSTPLHIGTGMGFAKMVDDMVVRAGPAKGGGARLPCIPGSSIKGKVRSRCEALANTLGLRVCGEHRCKRTPCIVCRIFGSRYAAGSLNFSDALLVEHWRVLGRFLGRGPEADLGSPDPFALTFVRTGNKLERRTRTVEPDFLFSLEHTACDLQYEGSITGQIDVRFIQGMNLVLPLEGWLLIIGLQSVDKIGALRSRGLGRCRVTVTRLIVDNGRNLASDLETLLMQEDYLLGLSEYETRTESHT